MKVAILGSGNGALAMAFEWARAGHDIYMYDFPSGQPVPQELMELQCNLGLKWMQEGRLDGLIFECNATMGVGLPSELWLREWIDKVKNTPIPD